jgi:putative hydrolase of HD superfamily
MDERLARQIAFILQLDQLKGVLRRTRVLHEPRRENSAEHSWQLAVMALLLAEHADEPVDTERVVRMVLLHDVVEIDAGDTFVYAEGERELQKAREQEAADRLFGLLPDDQGDLFHGLWVEFEAGETAEARFARALDRAMPVLLNYHGRGHAWRQHGVRAAQVRAVNSVIGRGSARLWAYLQELLDDAVARGWLAE